MSPTNKFISITSDTPIVQRTALTHLPTKLTQLNFLVWRTQLQSTLIGLGLLHFIDRRVLIPSPTLQDDAPNPDFSVWNRQDKIILSSMLGSLYKSIQPLVFTAITAKDMWDKLVALYANRSRSRSRIISLKNHLHNNPCNSRSLHEYLHDFRLTADELALASHPVDNDDLVLHIITGLGGDDYKNICAALNVRKSPISFGELHDLLPDIERRLKAKSPEPAIVTAHYTQRGKIQESFVSSHPPQFCLISSSLSN